MMVVLTSGSSVCPVLAFIIQLKYLFHASPVQISDFAT